MPTKRRFLLFLIVLAIMLLIKRAVGQEGAPTIGWDPPVWSCGPNIGRDSVDAWLVGTITGIVIGFVRASMAREEDTDTDLVLLKL